MEVHLSYHSTTNGWILTCPHYTNSGCGKGRRVLFGPWLPAKAALARNYFKVYPFQLTTRRIGNVTGLIHTPTVCVTMHLPCFHLHTRFSPTKLAKVDGTIFWPMFPPSILAPTGPFNLYALSFHSNRNLIQPARFQQIGYTLIRGKHCSVASLALMRTIKQDSNNEIQDCQNSDTEILQKHYSILFIS